jgi:hypothetical protein
MSDQILDTAGQPLLFINLHMAENSDSVVIVASIPCAAQKFLAGPADGSARVMARRSGSGDPFVDLSISPIDLTPFAGTSVLFDFKVHSLAVATGMVCLALPVRVTFRP